MILELFVGIDRTQSSVASSLSRNGTGSLVMQATRVGGETVVDDLEAAAGEPFRLVRVLDQSPKFLRYLSESGLSLGVEGEVAANHREAGVVMEARPGTALKVIQPELFFELLVSLLDRPPVLEHPNQLDQGCALGRIAECVSQLGPSLLDDQPLGRSAAAFTL